ncbi:MAG: GIY-YIG nuclease family protein [bacterium]
MWYVYIAKCKNKALYTGITTDIHRRQTEHKQGKGGAYTRSFRVTKILYQEEHPTRSEALKRESQIKGWTRNKKYALIYNDRKALKSS